MRYHKTSKAREALTTQGQALSQAERRILILCDGRRDAAHIVQMLGADAADSLLLLHQQGFLTVAGGDVASPAPGTTDIRSNLGGLANGLGKLWQRRGADADQAAPTPPHVPAPAVVSAPAAQRVTTSPAAAPVASPPRNSRRSMAACKMYILDMLQLQRTMEASALAVDIQTSAADQDALVTAMFDALRWLQEATKPGMFKRIAERLQETLPEQHLPRLQVLMLELGEASAVAPPANVVSINARAASTN